MAGCCASVFASYRDKYVPSGRMWVTEPGDAYLISNNSVEPTTAQLPKEATAYMLAGKDGRVMTLNGCDLVLGEADPCLCGKRVEGKLEVPAMSCAFIVV